MRPGHLQVFDGLRITTEHLNHFQGALHSAVEDVREILGLGRVHRGFAVERVNDTTIVVQPGIAFDRARNRVVADEPVQVAVEFAPDETERFVCVRYEQVLDGEVEGRFTLVWDSAAVVVRPTLPGPAELLVPVARLVRVPALEGTFIVAPLRALPEGVSEPEAAPAADVTPMPGTPSGAVVQGVIRLAARAPSGDPGGPLLATLLSAPLRLAITAAGSGSGRSPSQVSVLVDAAELPLTLSEVTSLSCHLVMNGRLQLESAPTPDPGASDSADAAGAPAPDSASAAARARSSVAFAARGSGECLRAGESLSQLGALLVEYRADDPVPTDLSRAPWSDAMTTHAVAVVPAASLCPGHGPWTGVTERLQPLQLIVLVVPGDSARLRFEARLAWEGAASEDALEWLESSMLRMEWNSLIVWKTLGGESAGPN